MLKKKKKLLYIITLGDYGGAQKFCYDFCLQYKNTVEITVICGTGGWLYDKLVNNGVTVIKMESIKRSISPLNDAYSIIRLTKHIKKIGYDTVFTHSAKAGTLGRIAAKLAGCPKIIYKVGGFVFNEPRHIISKFVYVIIEFLLSYITDVMIYVSKYDIKIAKKYYFRPKDSVLIYNGIKLEKSKLDNNNEAVILITVANFYPAKAHSIIIEVAQYLAKMGYKYKWYLIGKGPLASTIKEEVKAKNLGENIIFTGYLSSRGVKDYLSQSNIFILPSFKEGMPLAVLEAMNASLPVIVTRVGALPDFIVDGENGFLVKPNNVQELVKKIVKLIENKELQNNIGQKALKSIEDNFSIDEMWRNYNKIII